MIRYKVNQMMFCSSIKVNLEITQINPLNELFPFTISNLYHRNNQIFEHKHHNHLKVIIKNSKELDYFIEISLILAKMNQNYFQIQIQLEESQEYSYLRVLRNNTAKQLTIYNL